MTLKYEIIASNAGGRLPSLHRHMHGVELSPARAKGQTARVDVKDETIQQLRRRIADMKTKIANLEGLLMARNRGSEATIKTREAAYVLCGLSRAEAKFAARLAITPKRAAAAFSTRKEA